MTVDIFGARRDGAHRDAGRRSLGVSLLDALPEMAAAIPPEDRQLARRATLAPLRTLAAGARIAPFSRADPFALVILDGLVFRRTLVGERCVCEVLGAGDLVDTRSDDELWSVPGHSEYVVHESATVAVLNDRFRIAARRWPGLHEVVTVQTMRQARRASRHLAILALPRVEDRLARLFYDLADRWGRVTPDGIVVDFAVTHGVLGELVGSRRPTVSLAMRDLAAAGTVLRRADGRWLVAPACACAA